MPKEEAFLEFNRDEIFKNLIAAEGHLRNMAGEKYEAEHFSCVVKHLADAESHADEAISHSLTVRGDEESKYFMALRDRIRNLRKKIQTNHLKVKDAVREVREIRRFFESFNKPFNTEACVSCELTRYEPPRTTTENPSAEEKKPLYVASYTKNTDRKMAWKDTGIIVGGQHIGKGITLATDYVDAQLGKTGAPLQERPSVWINVAGGVALVLIPRLLKRLSPTTDMLMTIIGGYMTTKAWDYVQEYIAGGAVAVAEAVRVAPTIPTVTQPITPTAPAPTF